jgi:hypothetical protein
VIASFLASTRGALATVGGIGITAPEPIADSAESPIMLNAINLALTEVPVVRLNGEARRTLAEMVHVRLEITDELLTPSQFMVSCSNVLDEVSI